MSRVPRLPQKFLFANGLQCPTPAIVYSKCDKTIQNQPVLLTLVQVQNPLRLPDKMRPECAKVIRKWCVLRILSWKSA